MNKRFAWSLITLISILILIVGGICACEKNNTPENQYYTVTFNLDGGNVADKDLPVSLKVKDGATLNLSEYEPTKEGYDFAGWKIGDTAYQSNDKITITADITLTAQWTVIVVQSYQVAFDLNGGSMKNSQMQVDENTIINFSDYIPTLENYNFIGWRVADKVFASNESYTVKGNVTFIAQWRIKPTDANKFTFEETQDGNGYVLTGFVDDFNIENVAVPNEYNGKPITEIKDSVFFGNSSNALQVIKAVDLTNCTSLVKIGKNNFYMMDSLKAVNIANCSSLTEIGNYCFRDCINLESVSLAGCLSLKTIGNSCFSIAPKLTIIDLKGLSSLESIGSNCFYGYTYNQSQKYIPAQVLDFSDCVSLTTIGQQSFWYLNEVKTLDFSKTKLSVVDRQVIMGCSKLERVALPATLNPQAIANENLGINNLSEFIYECDNIKDITVDALSIYLCAENGVLYDIDKTIIFKYPAKSQSAEYTAPITVEKILSRAFENAQNLTAIHFDNCKLNEIAFSAFNGCTNSTLTVPFDAYGYYQDGSEVTFGNNWNSGVKQINYGERYLYFDFTIEGIDNGIEVYDEILNVTVSAKYGDDNCEISVKVNQVEAPISNGVYSIVLTEGSNTIVIKAECGEKFEEKTYTITYVNATPIIVASLDKDNPNTASLFTVQIKVGEVAQNISTANIKIVSNNGFSAPNYGDYEPPLSKVQTNDNTVTVTLSYSDWEMWGYDVDGEFKIKIIVTLSSGEKIEAEYRMIYEG